jgi:hypothetical protein
MKKLLFFLAICLAFSNALAVVPEDGVYLVIPYREGDINIAPSPITEGYPDNIDKRYILREYMVWREEYIKNGAYGGEPALLVVVDGIITRAHGPVYIDFIPTPWQPSLKPECPQMHLDLGQIGFTRQNDGSFVLSFNVETTDAGIPAIHSGRFFALHGVLNFDTPTAGKYTLTASTAALTQDLQSTFCTIENTMYVIKL